MGWSRPQVSGLALVLSIAMPDLPDDVARQPGEQDHQAQDGDRRDCASNHKNKLEGVSLPLRQAGPR